MKIIACNPYNKRFAAETYCFLNNMRERGLSNSTLICIFQGIDDKENILWEQLIEDFPEVEFFKWRDSKQGMYTFLSQAVDYFGYIPLIRPKLLYEYWKLHPEMENETFFYTDTDVLFTQNIDFSEFEKDDINYFSDAKGYTNIDYLDSKLKLEDNIPKFIQVNKYEEILKRDVPNELANICGINRQILEENKNNSGAAQYIIKNVNAQYWADVLNSCMVIKLHLHNANQEYMKGNTPLEKERNGWQSWCADIWAVNWELLKRDRKIMTPSSLDFSWALHKIDTLKSIYHNAGITSEKVSIGFDGKIIECPVFYKNHYSYDMLTPYDNLYQLKEIVNHKYSKQLCISWYCQELIKTKNKYNL